MTPLTPEQIIAVMERVPGCVRDERMSKHTNFRLGGPARLYAVLDHADAVRAAIAVADEVGVPWYVFGGGSNVLVADEGYEGLVIQSAIRTVVVEGNLIRCGSGAITAMVARMAADAGLTGFEWAVGVPGTIGGGVYGNAGCYGGEMKDAVETVYAYRLSDTTDAAYANDECGFGYRDSRFKRERHVILGCTLLLTSGDGDAAKQRMREIVEMRKQKQPLAQSSAGCAFKNVVPHDAKEREMIQSHADIPEQMKRDGRISAGWLVEHAGGQGMASGGISVSEVHANFLVNAGKGTAKDVVALLAAVKMRVQERYGVLLEEEVQLLGF